MFGRYFERTKGSRGPPGFGFKLTTSGNYDIENRRLCNVGESYEPNDAVNLNLARQLIQQELSTLLQATTHQREQLDDLELKIQVFQEQVKERIKHIEINIAATLELAVRNAKAIGSLLAHTPQEILQDQAIKEY